MTRQSSWSILWLKVNARPSVPCTMSWSVRRCWRARRRLMVSSSSIPHSMSLQAAHAACRERRAPSGAYAVRRPHAVWRLPCLQATRLCGPKDGARASSWSLIFWSASHGRVRHVAASAMRASPCRRRFRGSIGALAPVWTLPMSSPRARSQNRIRCAWA